MSMYLHLLGGKVRPDAEKPSLIHTLGPLDAMAEFQDGSVRLNYLPNDADNPQKAELERRADAEPGKRGYFLKRDGDDFVYAGTHYQAYHISDKAELSEDMILMLRYCRDNFRRILTLVPWLNQLEAGDACLLAAPGYADLHVDVFVRDLCHSDISLIHRTKDADGFMVPETAMTVRLYHNRNLAFPIDWQLGEEFRAAMAPDGRLHDPKEQARQSAFLNQWLCDLAKHGHAISTQQGANNE